jgi:hypothetical protein
MPYPHDPTDNLGRRRAADTTVGSPHDIGSRDDLGINVADRVTTRRPGGAGRVVTIASEACGAGTSIPWNVRNSDGNARRG